MGNFQKLHVWQIAKELAIKIYKMTQSLQLKKILDSRIRSRDLL
jgi:hypothetical protein